VHQFVYGQLNPDTDRLAWNAIWANDAGTPWGQIPLQIGLVPGEQTLEVTEMPTTTPETRHATV